MKPDWKDAPEWANWLAMDCEGEWRWYQGYPKPYDFGWYAEGKSEAATTQNFDLWEGTREARP